jgi:hypothetical protein
MNEQELQAEIEEAKRHFLGWAGLNRLYLEGCFEDVRTFDRLLNEAAKAFPSAKEKEQLINGISAYLGILVQERFRGVWQEHFLFGVSLGELYGIPGMVFSPRHLVEKKWLMGSGLSLERILGSIPQRISAARREREVFQMGTRTIRELLLELGKEEKPLALILSLKATEFSLHWEKRFQKRLVRSLVGVRELDVFLRSQYFFFSCEDELLFGMGVFLGEVARGLYGGKWEIKQTNSTAELVLEFQELELYPVGKILKALSIQPEGDSLEDYLRVIPSAREELRNRLN